MRTTVDIARNLRALTHDEPGEERPTLAKPKPTCPGFGNLIKPAESNPAGRLCWIVGFLSVHAKFCRVMRKGRTWTWVNSSAFV